MIVKKQRADNIWDACQGQETIQPLHITPWRVVEAQHISSTRDLVDSLEEHSILEALLEESKPFLHHAHQWHYLIFTPFRYPPLKYGSRFGNTLEPAIWYGSKERNTAFAEVAYYRFKFFKDTSADLGSIELPMTAFQSNIKTKKGVNLTNMPFIQYQDKISHPMHYNHSQSLGKKMREAGVQAFLFCSSRTKNGKNVGAFVPEVFVKKNGNFILTCQSWWCFTNAQTIEFTRVDVFSEEKIAFHP